MVRVKSLFDWLGPEICPGDRALRVRRFVMVAAAFLSAACVGAVAAALSLTPRFEAEALESSLSIAELESDLYLRLEAEIERLTSR